jgi:hypothetical protein
VSLLGQVVTSVPGEGETFAPATPLSPEEVDSAGCLNPEATLTSPEPEQTLSGVVEVRGMANIVNFAFYKVEIRELTAESIWRAISAGTEPKMDELLAVWDTSLVPAGGYALRLVVTDTAGNAPFPCAIRVRVVPTE